MTLGKRWKKNDIPYWLRRFRGKPDGARFPNGAAGVRLRRGGVPGPVSQENVDKPPYPVITLCALPGAKGVGTEAKTLYEAVNVPEVFKPTLANTKINVFEVAWLEEDQVRRFASDFRIVADYFVQKRENGRIYSFRKKRSGMCRSW